MVVCNSLPENVTGLVHRSASMISPRLILDRSGIWLRLLFGNAPGFLDHESFESYPPPDICIHGVKGIFGTAGSRTFRSRTYSLIPQRTRQGSKRRLIFSLVRPTLWLRWITRPVSGQNTSLHTRFIVGAARLKTSGCSLICGLHLSKFYN